MNSLFFIILSLSSIYTKETLRHVHVIYRHGDRAPIEIAPGNLNQANKWPFGLSQLTDIGMKQHFELGKWLRIKYKHFLGQKYRAEEIHVRSTNVPRTIMSAQSNLAGLYYDNNTPSIKDLNWGRIPIQILPQTSQIIMLPFACDIYNRRIAKIWEIENFKSTFEKFKVTFDILKTMSGTKDLQMIDVLHVFDMLLCEKSHNITWDSWVTKDIFDDLIKIDNLVWKLIFNDKEILKRSVGLFLDDIISHMQSIVQDEGLNFERLRMTSGHDTNLAPLLVALGILDYPHPTYASCLIIELLHRPKNESNHLKNWIVKVFFKTTDSTYSPTDIPERKLVLCKSEPCTLLDFINSLKSLTINLEDYQQLCLPHKKIIF